jgi:hypothetical protein
VRFKILDTAASAYVANTETVVGIGAGGEGSATLQFLYAASGATNLQVWAVNNTAARGVLVSSTPRIDYITVSSESTYPVPNIASFTPAAGESVSFTITGTGFTGATAVKINGTSCTSVSVVSDTEITATSPASFTTGSVTVTTPGGTATSAITFANAPGLTLLLLHADGTNGSTTFTDSSIYGVSCAGVSGAQISTAQYKFGTGSMYLNSGHVDTTGMMTMGFGTGDWTVDFWMYLPSAFSNPMIFIEGEGYGTSGTNPNVLNIYTGSSASGVYVGETGYGPSFLTFSYTWSYGSWQHVAIVEHSRTVTLYINGTSIGSNYDSRPNSYASGDISIGGDSRNAYSVPGYIDEFRISNIARWTSNFTPPTSPYVAD